MRPVPHRLALVDAPSGRSVRVVSVDPAVAAELAREGLLPGVILSVASRAPLGGPLVTNLGRTRLALAAGVAARVTVEHLTETSRQA